MNEKQTILIVDDDADLVKTLGCLLEAEGFNTLTAYEGIRAVEKANKYLPALILLDLQMPAGTGQTVLASLRSRNETRKIPVIVLTALDDPSLETAVLQGGAQDFLRKPCDPELLLQKIRGFLSQS